MSDALRMGLAAFLIVAVAQRVGELLLSRRNAQRVRARGAREYGAGHFPFIVAVHVLFFVSLTVEVALLGARPGNLWPLWLSLWVAAQGLRYAAIHALGDRWNVRILVVPGEPPVRSGPYKFLRHPNYVAVVVELIAASLLFGAWRTAIVITLLNAMALRIRIRAEDAVLVLAACFMALASMSSAQGIVRCAVCGQIVLGEYIEAEKLYFHDDHFRCEYCKKPIDGTYVPVDGKFYHGACYQKHLVVVCVVCNKVILEEHSENYWGDAWHNEHNTNTPACDFCGRFIVGGIAANRVDLPDGRRLCGLCGPASVRTVEAVRALASGVVESLRGHGIGVSMAGIPLLMLGRDRLQVLAPDPAHTLTGYTTYLFEPDGDPDESTFSIMLLEGMPATEMAFTVAHELMHVWMAKHRVSQDDVPWIEGSCHYAAYLVMQDENTRESGFQMDRTEAATDSIYGGGFRRVKRYVDKNGVEAWLDALLMNKRDVGSNEARREP